MATKQKTVKIRETKQGVFDILKSVAPGIFGSYVFADVFFFGEDPDDSSKLVIELNEEADT